MSVAEFPSRVVQPPAELYQPVDQPARFAITFEHVAYLALFALALLTHLWGLGDRALHHDETLHAAYSWRLYTGQGFEHDPLLHGPFLYHISKGPNHRPAWQGRDQPERSGGLSQPGDQQAAAGPLRPGRSPR